MGCGNCSKAGMADRATKSMNAGPRGLSILNASHGMRSGLVKLPLLRSPRSREEE